MRKHKVALILMALILVTAIGAKLYSNVVMQDDEWIGLGASSGRIIFDNQAVDRLAVMNARFAVGTLSPMDLVHIRAAATATDARVIIDAREDPELKFATNDGTTTAIKYTLGVDNDMVGDPFVLGTTNVDTPLVVVDAYGNVGVQDSTPSYDLDVNGDIRATGDVLANGAVFVGSVEDPTEDAAHMTTRASNDDGGYVFWARRNLTEGQRIFHNDDPGGGVAGPKTLLWVQWLVNDNYGGPIITTGNATIDCLCGGGSNEVLIAGSGDNTLSLCMGRAFPAGEKCSVDLIEEGSHNYDVSLLMMWVND